MNGISTSCRTVYRIARMGQGGGDHFYSWVPATYSIVPGNITNPDGTTAIGTIFFTPGHWEMHSLAFGAGTKSNPFARIVRRAIERFSRSPWSGNIIIPIRNPYLGAAFTAAYIPESRKLCAGLGFGASKGRNWSAGPLLFGPVHKADKILEGASISVGGQWSPGIGGQATGNHEGVLYGPTFGSGPYPSFSATATVSGCAKIF